MSADPYVQFFLNSSSNIAQLETIEISHPNFKNSHYAVRNHMKGITAKIETNEEIYFQYIPMEITENDSKGDLDYSLTIKFGDVGEFLPFDLDSIVIADGLFVEPTLIYRAYRSDDLEAPIFGPITLKIKNFAFDRYGAIFNAHADRANSQKTGELYTINRFPMMRAFLNG
jgi:hypothetical protein